MNSVKNIRNNKPAIEWIKKLSFSELPKINNVALLKMKLPLF